MKKRILKELKIIEQEKKVKVLYACESGSRAWGFPSKDSDYDLRFIYCHPLNWYLSIFEKRDVIEKSIVDELDISGWDFRKALRLFRKSNPPLMEWLNSPIVYFNSKIADEMRLLIPEYYSQTASSYHYLHMARGNIRAYLKGSIVWTKKYFYVLRPLMAVIWMEQGLGVVPTDFNIIIDKIFISDKIKNEIRKLIALKLEGDEMRHGKRNEVLSDFIEFEMSRLLKIPLKYPKPKISADKLDDLFRRTVLN